MGQYPKELRGAGGKTASIDPSRLFVTLRGSTDRDSIWVKLRKLRGVDRDLPSKRGGPLNEGPGHAWLKLASGRSSDETALRQEIARIAGVRASAPVYTVDGKRKRECHFTLNPHVLTILAAEAGSVAHRELVKWLDGRGLRVVEELSAGRFVWCTPKDESKTVFGMVEAIRKARHPLVSSCDYDPIPLESPLLGPLSPSTAEEQYWPQWNLQRIQMPDAWGQGTATNQKGHANVYVCVIDLGVSCVNTPRKHPELYRSGNVGFDLESGTGDAITGDPVGTDEPAAHGTACAGIACAEWGSTSGIVGVAPSCRLYVLQVTPPGGAQIAAAVARAQNAVDLPNQDATGAKAWELKHRRVILLPIASDGFAFTTAVEAAIQSAIAAGIPVCVGAGNDGGELAYPATVSGVIACGASTKDDEKRAAAVAGGPGAPSEWSSNASLTYPFVLAPGVGVTTTDLRDPEIPLPPAGYGTGDFVVTQFSGTSAATAHVAGLAALLLSHNPRLTAEDVRRIIATTCDHIRVGAGTIPYAYASADTSHPDGMWNNRVSGAAAGHAGYGRINANNAVTLALTARATVSTTSIDFGTVSCASSNSKDLTITNTKTECADAATDLSGVKPAVCSSPLVVHVVLSGAAFTVDGGVEPLDFTLTPGQSRSIAVGFAAPASGEATVSGTITVQTDDAVVGPTDVAIQAHYLDNLKPELTFLDGAGAVLRSPVFVPSSVASVDQDYRIRATDVGDGFLVSALTLAVTWKERASGASRAGTLAWNGAAWAWAGDPVGATGPVVTLASASTGTSKDATYTGKVTVKGDVAEVTLLASLSDQKGNVGTNQVRLGVTIPSDIVLALDYTGSMLTANKWQSVKSAASMFSSVYGALRSTTLDDRLGAVRFFTAGDGGPNMTDVLFPLGTPGTPATTLGTGVVDPDPYNFTPIGWGVLASKDLLSAPADQDKWRNRVIVLMTDGMENQPPKIADILGAPYGTDQHVLRRTEDPKNGIVIHACAFGPDGTVDVSAIESLAVDNYGGELCATTDTTDPMSALALKRAFLNILASALQAVELRKPEASTTALFKIESRVKRVVFVVTDNVTLTVAAKPSAHVAPIPAAVAGDRFTTIAIDNPEPGDWTLGFASSATAEAYAFIDIALSARFSVVRSQQMTGAVVTLRAMISDDGRPVSGAHVEVGVHGPNVQAGVEIVEFAKSPAFNKAQWAARLKASQTSAPDAPGIRHDLIQAALAAKQVKYATLRERVVLAEVAPGRYEGVFNDTGFEGTYTFQFGATGTDRYRYAFGRNLTVARYFSLMMSSGKTIIDWRHLVGPRPQWIGTITPRSTTGVPLGPGLGPRLNIRAFRPVTHVKIPVTDQLDGTYSVTLASKSVRPPALDVRLGKESMVLGGGLRSYRAVRVTLLDTAFGMRAATPLHAAVLPGGEQARFRRTALDPKRHLKRQVDTEVVLFDDVVEVGTSLAIALGTTAIDEGHLLRGESPGDACTLRLTGELEAWEGIQVLRSTKRGKARRPAWTARICIELL